MKLHRESGDILFPTPWNHIEAGILFGLKLPLLVFREDGIRGGIFDDGVKDAFVHLRPKPRMTKVAREALRSVFIKWQSEVCVLFARTHMIRVQLSLRR